MWKEDAHSQYLHDNYKNIEATTVNKEKGIKEEIYLFLWIMWPIYIMKKAILKNIL